MQSKAENRKLGADKFKAIINIKYIEGLASHCSANDLNELCTLLEVSHNLYVDYELPSRMKSPFCQNVKDLIGNLRDLEKTHHQDGERVKSHYSCPSRKVNFQYFYSPFGKDTQPTLTAEYPDLSQ